MLTTFEKKHLLSLISTPEVRETLEGWGYEKCGQGHFSFAFKRGESVVKLGYDEVEKDGARLYLEWLRDTTPSNPAFPKVYGVWTMRGFNGQPVAYIAEMEALTSPASEYNWGGSYENPSHARMQWIMENGVYARTMDSTDTLTAEEATVRDAALLIAKTFGGKVDMDIHHGNWLLRGTQPVITDPISYIREEAS